MSPLTHPVIQRILYICFIASVIFLLQLGGYGFALPSAIAAPKICQHIDQHEVCIRRIKRSAKNYWEYWALLEVDGHIRPKETYNCRDRFLIDQANILVPFSRDFTGDFVCQLYVDKQTYLERFNPPPRLTSPE